MVLCPRCAERGATAPLSRRTPGSGSHTLCLNCGEVLVRPTQEEVLLECLSRLARVGISPASPVAAPLAHGPRRDFPPVR